MKTGATIQFLGAARCVTGSKFLLRTAGSTTLIDCGLFQGLRELRQRNWEPFPFPPAQIDRVILTHAHIDHTGYLPRLCKEGFEGHVYCTPSTAELLGLLLPDCGHLQEEDARYAAMKSYSKHTPPLPLFTVEEARASLRLLRPMNFAQGVALEDGIVFTYHPTGHILGAGSLEIRTGKTRLWFSGDLGRYHDEVMNPPTQGSEADYIFVESTYGNRLHASHDVSADLADTINRTARRGGAVLIPAFAIGRTQTMLYHIRQLEDAGRIPHLPVFIDSPMAVDASALYCEFGHEENLKLDLTMTDDECCPLRCRETTFVRTPEESKRINDLHAPAIIIAASGMATGGRVVHHLANRLPDKRNTVLLVGYQAEGTRGRALLNGEKKLKIHGQFVPVRAEVASISGLSAHGDQRDLMRWLSGFRRAPRRVFLIHGEEDGLNGLAGQIRENLKWPTHIPGHLERAELHAEPDKLRHQ
jgi:metallo-beta-lactamase family protein